MAIIATPLLTLSVLLTATVAQYAPVTASGGNASNGSRILGFTQLAGVAGERVPVVVLGTTIAIASASIGLSAPLKASSATQVGTPPLAGAFIGVALTGAAGAGEQIEVLLAPN